MIVLHRNERQGQPWLIDGDEDGTVGSTDIPGTWLHAVHRAGLRSKSVPGAVFSAQRLATKISCVSPHEHGLNLRPLGCCRHTMAPDRDMMNTCVCVCVCSHPWGVPCQLRPTRQTWQHGVGNLAGDLIAVGGGLPDGHGVCLGDDGHDGDVQAQLVHVLEVDRPHPAAARHSDIVVVWKPREIMSLKQGISKAGMGLGRSTNPTAPAVAGQDDCRSG